MQIETAATWDDLRVLLALHRHKSFLGAGKALGVSTSTAARRIDALEASLGRALVQRSSAGTHVEPDALELVTLAEQLELGLSAARRAESDARIAGVVRISCGEGFVRPVTHVLAELRRRHPELAFELSSESRLVDLARREADIGIRKTRSSSSQLVERKLGNLSFALYASRDYVERRLRSERLTKVTIGRHDFIAYEGALMAAPHMAWLKQQGAARFPFRTTSDLAFQEAAEEGVGIALLATPQGDESPRLVRLELESRPPLLPVYLVFHKDFRRVPRVRVVLSAFESAFRRALG